MLSVFKFFDHLAINGGVFHTATAGLTLSFRKELFLGWHCLSTTEGVRAADTLKAALYLDTATIGPQTTTYSNSGEHPGTGNYIQTGNAVQITNTIGTNSVPTPVAYFTPASITQWTSATLSNFSAVLIYNVTQSGRTISIHTFAVQNVTGGSFTLTMPAHDRDNALIRLA